MDDQPAASQLSLPLIQEACRFLEGRIRRTPVEYSQDLSARLGVPVFLKLECLQKTGSFKLRGALFRMSKLSVEEKRHGIATCSAGNHGKAVAFASSLMEIRPTIYVPRNVDESKYRAMLALGAEVLKSDFTGYDDTESWAIQEAARAGKVFISAFDDYRIMAGNGGSLATEILEDVAQARQFILPVGGGGLAAGFSFYAKERFADSHIICCQHRLSPALQLSLEKGVAVTRLPGVETTAGGLEGGIGLKTFGILKTRVDGIALLSEDEIFQAVRWMLQEHQYLMEPSAAVTVAACLTGKVRQLTAPIVVIVSGRNVDVATVRRILA